jgi:hypothetical protein
LNEHFAGYELTAEVAGPFIAAQRRYRILRGDRFGFRIELLDGNGRVVGSEQRSELGGPFMGNPVEDSTASPVSGLKVPLDDVAPGWPNWALLHAIDIDNFKSIRLSPSFGLNPTYGNVGGDYWFHRQTSYPRGGHCDAWEVRVEVALSAADLANVRGYRVTAVE